MMEVRIVEVSHLARVVSAMQFAEFTYEIGVQDRPRSQCGMANTLILLYSCTGIRSTAGEDIVLESSKQHRQFFCKPPHCARVSQPMLSPICRICCSSLGSLDDFRI